jgi:Plasmid pRiA4b ORF-3-like protein
MKRRPKHSVSGVTPSEPAADANAILQVKVWLVGISPMVWRRVLVPTTFTLRELHGVIQVAMGWEGITSMFSSCVPALRLVGTVGVLAGRDLGGATLPQGCAVYL